MTRILGIDPGSRKTGFGVIDCRGGELDYVTSGVIKLPEGELPGRLKIIFDAITQICEQQAPDLVAVEQIFMARNASSALKLGHARGAAITAAVAAGLPVYEYEARKVKQAIVGTGGADKAQVQHMVKALLRLPGTPGEDAADALAVALCHANTRGQLLASAGKRRFRRGRMV